MLAAKYVEVTIFYKTRVFTCIHEAKKLSVTLFQSAVRRADRPYFFDWQTIIQAHDHDYGDRA